MLVLVFKGRLIINNMKTYDIYGLMKFTLCKGRLGRRLGKFLSPFLTKREGEDCIELYIGSPFIFPRRAENNYTGFYKGIYWRLAFIKNGEGHINKIYFCSAGFNSFLLLRIVIIPYLKHILVRNGGFYVLGSSFVVDSKTYFLFGMPGSGKSSITLNALENNAQLIGDGALIISPEGTVSSFLNEIEFRYLTVRNTSFWKNLKADEKIKLQLCHLISQITFRYLSFNISIVPSRLGCIELTDKSQYQHIGISISPDGTFSPISVEELSNKIVAWNCWYNRIYGNYFSKDIEKEIEQMRHNIDSFLSGCYLWSVPVGCTFNEIISLRN